MTPRRALPGLLAAVAVASPGLATNPSVPPRLTVTGMGGRRETVDLSEWLIGPINISVVAEQGGHRWNPMPLGLLIDDGGTVMSLISRQAAVQMRHYRGASPSGYKFALSALLADGGRAEVVGAFITAMEIGDDDIARLVLRFDSATVVGS